MLTTCLNTDYSCPPKSKDLLVEKQAIAWYGWNLQQDSQAALSQSSWSRSEVLQQFRIYHTNIFSAPRWHIAKIILIIEHKIQNRPYRWDVSHLITFMLPQIVRKNAVWNIIENGYMINGSFQTNKVVFDLDTIWLLAWYRSPIKSDKV